MTEMMVIESDGESLAERIARRVARFRGDIRISSVKTPGALRPDGTDILVIAPGCGSSDTKICPDQEKVRCRLMLLPGGTSVGFAEADCVVTYGMGAKNTLTLSSIGEKDCVLALQRELVTAAGGILDRQELVVHSTGTAEEILAATGAMLLLGIMPE